MGFRKVVRIAVLLFGFSLFATQHARAADDASEFISGLGSDALRIIRSSETPAQRRADFSALFTKGFDVPAIGRFVLGRYWRTSTPEQQSRYLDLFGRYVISIYSDRFANYSGEQFEVLGSQQGPGGQVLVNSQILRPSGGQPIHIDWMVAHEQAGYKIADVIVEGVSMTVTQRQEFGSVISQNGGNVQSLIDLLQNRVDTANQ